MCNLSFIYIGIIKVISKNMSLLYIVQLLLIMLIVLSLASLLTVLERKGLAASQRRIGPSYNGWFGLVQIAQDGIKLVYKDYYLHNSVHNKYLAICCILNFIYSYLLFLFIYIDLVLFLSVSFIVLIIICILMINHISIVLCGIFINNSKWTMLSSIRLIILFIIYDIIIFLILFCLSPVNIGMSNIYIGSSLNLNIYLTCQSGYSNIIKYPILFLIYLFVILIECGRIPIDLIEAESELISGYSIEYSGFLYALFASAEYSVMLFHCFLLSVLFIGYSSFYMTFVYISIYFLIFIIVRSTLPRVIYTHLLLFTFHYMLPLVLIILLSFCLLI